MEQAVEDSQKETKEAIEDCKKETKEAIERLDKKITENMKVSPRLGGLQHPPEEPTAFLLNRYVSLQEVNTFRMKLDATATFFIIAAFSITFATNALKVMEALGL